MPCDNILCTIMHRQHSEGSVLDQHEESSGSNPNSHANLMHKTLGSILP